MNLKYKRRHNYKSNKRCNPFIGRQPQKYTMPMGGEYNKQNMLRELKITHKKEKLLYLFLIELEDSGIARERIKKLRVELERCEYV